MKGKVHSVHLSDKHSIRKYERSYISIIEGFGVEGDAHAGKKVRHRYLVKKDPGRLNLRQVHLIPFEIYSELNEKGFNIQPGDMGENINCMGIDVMNLPLNTILKIGESVELKVTGMREPCYLLDKIEQGLMKAVIEKKQDGELIRKAGIMTAVLKGLIVMPSDEIHVILPKKPWIEMDTV
jgi:MOSC domain-containing protein YiiM